MKKIPEKITTYIVYIEKNSRKILEIYYVGRKKILEKIPGIY